MKCRKFKYSWKNKHRGFGPGKSAPVRTLFCIKEKKHYRVGYLPYCYFLPLSYLQASTDVPLQGISK
jgi:hypothetical protein